MCELFDGLVKSFDQWKDLLSITFHVTELTVPEGFTLNAFPICIPDMYIRSAKISSICQGATRTMSQLCSKDPIL